MNSMWRSAAVLVSATLLATGPRPVAAWPEPGKDWFGRPHEPCEPKCYWQWWLGRKEPPGGVSNPGAQPPRPPQPAGPAATRTAPGASPGPQPRPDDRARPKAGPESGIGAKADPSAKTEPKPETDVIKAPPGPSAAPRPEPRIGPTTARSPGRAAAQASSPSAEAWRAEPFDTAAIGLMGPLPQEAPSEAEEAPPLDRVASTFAPLAALVVRRSFVFGDEAAGVVALASDAHGLGDLAPEIRAAGFEASSALLGFAEGLDKVASGEIAGFLVRSSDAGFLALADRPALVALPIASAKAFPSKPIARMTAGPADGSDAQAPAWTPHWTPPPSGAPNGPVQASATIEPSGRSAP